MARRSLSVSDLCYTRVSMSPTWKKSSLINGSFETKRVDGLEPNVYHICEAAIDRSPAAGTVG